MRSTCPWQFNTSFAMDQVPKKNKKNKKKMASMSLTSALQKLSSSVNGQAIIARRSPWGSTRALVTGALPPQGSLGGEDAQNPVLEAVGGGEMMNKGSEDASRGMASASAAAPLEEEESETYETVESVIDQVASGVNSAAADAKSAANETILEVESRTESLEDRAKQLAQEAWENTKGTAEKVKESVVGMAEDGKENIKENAEAIKSAMNTKNIR